MVALFDHAQHCARRVEEVERLIEELTLENSILESYHKRHVADSLADTEEDKRRHNR